MPLPAIHFFITAAFALSYNSPHNFAGKGRRYFGFLKDRKFKGQKGQEGQNASQCRIS